jgi:hypothetical protein
MPGLYALVRLSLLAGTLALAGDCHFFSYLFDSHWKTSFLALMIWMVIISFLSERFNLNMNLICPILYHITCTGTGLFHLSPRSVPPGTGTLPGRLQDTRSRTPDP